MEGLASQDHVMVIPQLARATSKQIIVLIKTLHLTLHLPRAAAGRKQAPLRRTEPRSQGVDNLIAGFRHSGLTRETTDVRY